LGRGEIGIANGQLLQLGEGFVCFSSGDQVLDRREFTDASAQSLCGNSEGDQCDDGDGDDHGQAIAAGGFEG
jgi:hypothetical protein